MIISKNFLRIFEERNAKKVYHEKSKVVTELEDHISMAMAENASLNIESAEATTGSKNVETLCKAYSQLQKAETEQLKLELQIAEANKQRMVNWDNILPKVAGVVVTGVVTAFWICLEQGTPLPMRLVQMASNLTMPRNL